MKPRVLNKHTITLERHDEAVYIGRPTKWGNPFHIVPGKQTREQVVQRFAEYLRNNPELMAAARKELRGRDLLCFCAPLACHGDILLEVANSDEPA